MMEGKHKDTVSTVKNKSGWRFSNYVFEISGYHFVEKIAIRACDVDHAWKQANKWAKEKGFEIIRIME